MTNALLIVFGFIELLLRFVFIVIMIITIIGFLFFMCFDSSEELEALMKPTLWEILRKRLQ